jgi:hypothetical protein
VWNSAYRNIESTLSVYLGIHNIRGTSESRKVTIKKVIIHPHYCHSDFANDIAVIQLDEFVSSSKHVGFSCLPPLNNAVYPGELNESVVVGWGIQNVKDSGSNSNVLNNVVIKIMKQKGGCIGLPSHICAGDIDGGKDSIYIYYWRYSCLFFL